MDLNLPPLPPRMNQLSLDKRGYPVPWFVAWFLDGRPCTRGIGEPDFRVIMPGALDVAYRNNRCWICGQTMGVHRVFAIGPMCVINRVTSEPPSHRDCAEFAAKACPFLTRPRQKRDHKDMPEFAEAMPGEPIQRNPGAVCLYETRKYNPFMVDNGYLFRLGDPEQVDWYARGRKATRAEIEESIESGYPILYDMAVTEGPDAVSKLAYAKSKAMKYLPVE